MGHGQHRSVSSSFRTLTERYLEPVLVRAGFAKGQWGDDGVGVIFCAAGDDYVHRHPGLTANGEQWDDVYCVDVMIEGTVAGGIRRFDVEFEPLDDLLARTGHGREVPRLSSLFRLERPDDDLACLARILTRLYDGGPRAEFT